MESEILKQRFDDHEKNDEIRFRKVEDAISDIQRELGGKVSWVVFWSIIVVLVGSIGGMFGLLYKEIKEVRTVTIETGSQVSYIKGVLDNADIVK